MPLLAKSCDDLVVVYVTTPSREMAHSIGLALLEAHLVACVNISQGIESLYWWQGKLEQAGEWAFIAKTQKQHMQALCELVRALHSYECPCIAAWPIVQGETHYLHWIRATTTLEHA